MSKPPKVLELLETLSSTELDRFGEYLRSPFLVTQEGLDSLYRAYLPYLRGQEKQLPPDESVYQLLFPGESFDKKRLSYPLHYLNAELERYLGLEHYFAQGHRREIDELKALSERDQQKHLRQCWKRLERRRTPGQPSMQEYWQEELDLQSLAAAEALKRKDMEAYQEHNQQASDHLDELYFFRRLKFSCERLNEQRMFSISFSHPFSREVVRFLGRQERLQPLTAMYLHIYHTLIGEEEDRHFEHLMDLVGEHQRELSPSDMREVYLFALNFCIRKFRTGYKEFSQKALYLYQEGIASGILFDGPYLSSRTFTNAVKQALVLRRYDWIEAFISDYGDKLSPETRRDTLCYNRADYYYHLREYDRVLDQLQQLRFSDLHYHLGSRVLLLKTYYHMDAIDSLLSLLASFSVYLRRKKELSQGLKRTYLNFCNLLHRILLLDPSSPRKKIRNQIETTNPLAERAWLMELVG